MADELFSPVYKTGYSSSGFHKYLIDNLQNAVVKVCKELRTTSKETTHWSDYEEEDLWSELVACILGSRVSYELTIEVTQYLRSIDLMNLEYHLHTPEAFEDELVKALSRSFIIPKERSVRRRYPFPFMRSSHIRRSMESLYLKNGSIKNILANSKSAAKARLTLISTVTGIGPKQASLFLRNIGYADDLAVLDAHVIRYIQWMGFDFDHPMRVHSIKKYEQVERQFCLHAEDMGFSVAQFDIGVWVVTRVARKELNI